MPMKRDARPEKRIRAAIVGGGIGGLSAAYALFLRGIDVTVFEQAGTLREVGTGITISPNARRQLERIGLWGAVEQAGAKIGDGSEYYRMDGTIIGRILPTDSTGQASRRCSPPDRGTDGPSLHRVP